MQCKFWLSKINFYNDWIIEAGKIPRIIDFIRISLCPVIKSPIGSCSCILIRIFGVGINWYILPKR